MKLRDKFQVKPGHGVKLKDWNPDNTAGYDDKHKAKEMLQETCERLSQLQYRLYAENRRSVLIILQAMDAGGKDGAIRHVMGPLNPQGCRVTSFKAPTPVELAHDFLWRVHRAVPGKGEIGIFNRSHYEDVLVVRVHHLVPRKVWSKRFSQINDFEKMLAAQGVHILKFYLHISKDEQLERLKARVDDPDKHWKISLADFEERRYWDDYMRAYEDVLEKCSTKYAPWYVIPANHKWFRNLALSRILLETLEEMDPQFPPPACDIRTLKIE
ncbi:MAG: polyphosphate kinase 2 family protein [Sedimentisphaerales bacterium]|nr:polyphosphate kinase 2 family protein [Sedimentisphaerales bacterium]